MNTPEPGAFAVTMPSALMEATLEVCPGRDVVLDAQSPLAGWYESLGFSVSGPEFLDDGIPHLPMRRAEGSVGV